MNANQSVELYEEVLTLFSDISTLAIPTSVSGSGDSSISQHKVDLNKLVLTDSALGTDTSSATDSTTTIAKLSEHKLALLSERVKWMQSMIDLKDFPMLLCFMSTSLKDSMPAFLLAAKTNNCNDNVLLENIARIIDSYKLN